MNIYGTEAEGWDETWRRTKHLHWPQEPASENIMQSAEGFQREALTLWLLHEMEENQSRDKSTGQTEVGTLKIKTLKGRQRSLTISEKESFHSNA